MTLPAEVLPARDVERLLAAFGPGRVELRNYAITLLLYRAGLKLCDVLALERRHFEPGQPTLMVPRESARLSARSSWMRRRRRRWIAGLQFARNSASVPRRR
jgi:integrase